MCRKRASSIIISRAAIFLTRICIHGGFSLRAAAPVDAIKFREKLRRKASRGGKARQVETEERQREGERRRRGMTRLQFMNVNGVRTLRRRAFLLLTPSRSLDHLDVRSIHICMNLANSSLRMRPAALVRARVKRVSSAGQCVKAVRRRPRAECEVELIFHS